MNFKSARAIAHNQVTLFFSDRRGAIFILLTPIAIAAFFGFFTSGLGGKKASKVKTLVVDADRSEISRALVRGLFSDQLLNVSLSDEEAAREAVRKGKALVTVLLPPGFGEAASRAFFGLATKPEIGFLYDPSHEAELAIVTGILNQYAMQAVGQAVFTLPMGATRAREAKEKILADSSLPAEHRDDLLALLNAVEGLLGRKMAGKTMKVKGFQGFTIPYRVKAEAVTSRKGVAYNGFAHSFAGMGVQFVLFAAIGLGEALLLERQNGVWRRLRAAPLSKATLLAGKALGGTVIGVISLGLTFGAGMLLFGVRVAGSWWGFLLLCVTTSLMAATFGLVLGALGKTPQAMRGLAILVVIVLTMLGGGWVPAFVFPAWLQKLTLAVPTRWAVDGFDAVTWRGVGFEGVWVASLVLLGFTGLFGLVALWRFPWEEAA